MHRFRRHFGQGATKKPFAASAGTLLAQGATEYLVLLAVVLIVALVSVALLGFFPGMASDSQRAQSEMHWKSASPIAITEWAAKASSANGYTYPYLRVRNNGAYPIRITGVVGGDGTKITQFYSSSTACGADILYNITDYYYLGPGEEKYFGFYAFYGSCDRRFIIRSTSSASYYLGGASSLCENSTGAPGTVIMPSMGFEYIQYIDGQQITKRQMGQDVIIKCLPPV